MIRHRTPIGSSITRTNRPPSPPKITVVAALGKHAALFDLKDAPGIRLHNISDPGIEDVRKTPHVYLYSTHGYDGLQRELCHPSHPMHVFPAVDVDISVVFAVDLDTNEQRTLAAVRAIKMAWEHYCSLAFRGKYDFLDPTDTVTIMALSLTGKIRSWLIDSGSGLRPKLEIYDNQILISVGDCVLWDSDTFTLGDLRLNTMRQELALYAMDFTQAFSSMPETACPICEGFMAPTADHSHEGEDPDPPADAAPAN